MPKHSANFAHRSTAAWRRAGSTSSGTAPGSAAPTGPDPGRVLALAAAAAAAAAEATAPFLRPPPPPPFSTCLALKASLNMCCRGQERGRAGKGSVGEKSTATGVAVDTCSAVCGGCRPHPDREDKGYTTENSDVTKLSYTQSTKHKAKRKHPLPPPWAQRDPPSAQGERARRERAAALFTSAARQHTWRRRSSPSSSLLPGSDSMSDWRAWR